MTDKMPVHNHSAGALRPNEALAPLARDVAAQKVSRAYGQSSGAVKSAITAPAILLCAVIASALLAVVGCPMDSGSPLVNRTSSYTVTFYKGEGSGTVPAAISGLAAGAEIQLPAPDGLTGPGTTVFEGWFDDTRIYAAREYYTVNGNVTFVAKWESSCTVAYDKGNGVGAPQGDQIVKSGTQIILPAPDGLTGPDSVPFGGWHDGSDLYTAGAQYTVSGDVTFTALWGEPCRVIFAAGDGEGSPPSPRIAVAGMQITLPAADGLTGPGSTVFEGWSGTSEEIYPAGGLYIVEKDVTLTAAWQLVCTVTFSKNSDIGGTAPAPQTVKAGTSITLPGQGDMTPNGPKIFDGWIDENATSYAEGDSYPVSRDVTLTAKWVTMYTVIFNKGDGTGTAPIWYSKAGAAIILPGQGDMIAPEGGFFSGWTIGTGETYGGPRYEAGKSYTVNADVEFTAKWRLTIGEVYDYLKDATGGTAAAPVQLPIDIDITAEWGILTESIAAIGKYVSLDLSNSTGGEPFVGAGSGKRYIVSLTLPDSVKTIGASAFSGCTALTEVSFPSVTAIGDMAFADTGPTPLTIELGYDAPDIEGVSVDEEGGEDEEDSDVNNEVVEKVYRIFYGVTEEKHVTIKIPGDAPGYGDPWQTKFTGGNENIILWWL